MIFHQNEIYHSMPMLARPSRNNVLYEITVNHWIKLNIPVCAKILVILSSERSECT